MLKAAMLRDFLLSLMADYLVIPIAMVGGIMLLMVPANARYRVWTKAVFTGLLALLFAKIISLFYQGQRPFEVLGVEPGASFLPNPGFPSDHALLVFTIAFVVWASTKNKPVGVLLFLAAVAVAVGRVLALVHTPQDVIGGLVCAFAAAVVVYGRQFFTTQDKYLVL